MKRVLLLLTATAVMALMFASAAPAVVHVCSNHPNQQSAQAALDQDPSLAPTLDPDGDGTACEDFFGAMASPTATATASPTATATATATASPTATATASPLPTTGGSSLVWPLTLVVTLVLVGSGVAALALLRRSAS
jgi:hypothetical protein